MRIKDFFEEPTETGNPWDSSEPVLNAGLITQLAQGTAHDPNPLETALELTRLVRAEYESYGTEKSHLRTDEDEARAALKALRMLLKRRGIAFDPHGVTSPSSRATGRLKVPGVAVAGKPAATSSRRCFGRSKTSLRRPKRGSSLAN